MIHVPVTGYVFRREAVYKVFLGRVGGDDDVVFFGSLPQCT